MKRKIRSSLLAVAIIIGISPIRALAEWKQASDNSWSWNENGLDISAGKSIVDGIKFSNISISTDFKNVEGKFVIISKSYERLEEKDFSIEF